MNQQAQLLEDFCKNFSQTHQSLFANVKDKENNSQREDIPCNAQTAGTPYYNKSSGVIRNMPLSSLLTQEVQNEGEPQPQQRCRPDRRTGDSLGQKFMAAISSAPTVEGSTSQRSQAQKAAQLHVTQFFATNQAGTARNSVKGGGGNTANSYSQTFKKKRERDGKFYEGQKEASNTHRESNYPNTTKTCDNRQEQVENLPEQSISVQSSVCVMNDDSAYEPQDQQQQQFQQEEKFSQENQQSQWEYYLNCVIILQRGWRRTLAARQVSFRYKVRLLHQQSQIEALKQHIQQLESQHLRTVENNLLTQKTEVQTIIEQYSKFIEKLLGDKKILSQTQEKLRYDNTELEKQLNAAKSDNEELQNTLQNIEQRYSEEQERFRRECELHYRQEIEEVCAQRDKTSTLLAQSELERQRLIDLSFSIKEEFEKQSALPASNFEVIEQLQRILAEEREKRESAEKSLLDIECFKESFLLQVQRQIQAVTSEIEKEKFVAHQTLQEALQQQDKQRLEHEQQQEGLRKLLEQKNQCIDNLKSVIASLRIRVGDKEGETNKVVTTTNLL